MCSSLVEKPKVGASRIEDRNAAISESRRPKHTKELIRRPSSGSSDSDGRLTIDLPYRRTLESIYRALGDANPGAVPNASSHRGICCTSPNGESEHRVQA
jgi:hypothetical protein